MTEPTNHDNQSAEHLAAEISQLLEDTNPAEAGAFFEMLEHVLVIPVTELLPIGNCVERNMTLAELAADRGNGTVQ